MAKTRSQTEKMTIKKEEEEDCKSTLGLGSARNKITKRKSSKRNNRHLPAQQVKVEDDTDTKALLKSPSKSPKLPKGQRVSQEQIDQLIDAIVNDKMRVIKAGRRAKLSSNTAYYYYNLYKNDPNKKIPVARNQSKANFTQEQIENLIRYIKKDKMSIPEASAKANMTDYSGRKYYNKYLEDPNHNIPVPQSRRYYTQDQINKFIGYIVNDKMSIKTASLKARINNRSGRAYYHNYFDVQNPDIAKPRDSATPKHYTQDQKNKLISYIINDKMSIAAASRKVNIRISTARKYYRQYVKDRNMEIPMSKCSKRYTQDKINELMSYIVDGKMNIKAASKKANVNYTTASKYYHRYLKDHNIDVPIRPSITQDQIDELIGYIAGDKMTVSEASRKANMGSSTGWKYYQKYAKDHNIDLPTRKFITQEKINELIGYIVDDKMSIREASKKLNMTSSSGCRYYHRYLDNQKRDAPTRHRQAASAPKK